MKPTEHKYLEILEDLDSLKERMENFVGAINLLKQKLKQHHKAVTELNERNSVDEGEKSFWCFRIQVDERPIEEKCEKQCTYCRINHQNDF